MVLSGGMDSVTMLYEYAHRIDLAVNFIYGSIHSSLLEGSDAIPEGEYDFDNMKSTVVPFRNGIMLAAAAGLAESRGIKAVMIANHAGDHALYPDCRDSFIRAMAGAIAEGTYDRIELRAPYSLLTKTQIAERGKSMELDYSETYSCYKGGEKHCGRCGTCQERKSALAEAGIDDPTEYEE